MPPYETLGRVAALVRDALAVGAALSLVFGTVTSVLWLAFADTFVTRMRRLLELDTLARSEDVAALAATVRSLAGEDRVIRTLRGRSYVEEPVYLGDPVVLILFVERTDVGASCEFLAGNSVFEDYAGVRIGGSALRPTEQLSPDPQRLRVVLEQPAALSPGRVAISLILKYRCGDQTVFDETEPIAFRLLAPPTP